MGFIPVSEVTGVLVVSHDELIDRVVDIRILFKYMVVT